MTLYNAVVPTYSPFLDAQWITTAARLSRSDRLGSNFHRYVISQNFPALLEFPLGAEIRVRPRAPWSLTTTNKSKYVTYSPFADVKLAPLVVELLYTSRHLRTLAEPSVLYSALQSGRLTGLFLALHFVGEIIEERGIKFDS